MPNSDKIIGKKDSKAAERLLNLMGQSQIDIKNIKKVTKDGQNIIEGKTSFFNKTGLDAIALRFIIDTLQPDLILSGASNETHLDQNLKALDLKLSPDHLELLKSLKIDSTAYWNERSDLTWN